MGSNCQRLFTYFSNFLMYKMSNKLTDLSLASLSIKSLLIEIQYKVISLMLWWNAGFNLNKSLSGINWIEKMNEVLHTHVPCWIHKGLMKLGPIPDSPDYLVKCKSTFWLNSVKSNSLTFLEMWLFAFLPRVRWADRYHSHICTQYDATASSQVA